MLLQRMIRENEIGLNYDYMGYAEYEFGATSKSREAMARSFIANDLEARVVTLVEQFGKSQMEPIEVVVLGNKETIDYIDHQREKDLNRHWYVKVDKSSMRSDSDKISELTTHMNNHQHGSSDHHAYEQLIKIYQMKIDGCWGEDSLKVISNPKERNIS